MSIEVKVPVLPESVDDATVAAWHKKAGEPVYRDENLVDLETDKVVLEVPSPADGILREITREAGETVLSDEILAVIEAGEVERPAAGETSPEATGEAEPAPAAAAAPADTQNLSPATRRIVEEEGVDPAQVPATGACGGGSTVISCCWIDAAGRSGVVYTCLTV